jgi:hypothetical protein
MCKKNKNIFGITVKDVKNCFKHESYKIKKDVDSFINLPENIFSEMNQVFVVSTKRVIIGLHVILIRKWSLKSWPIYMPGMIL